ncbi:ABC transporter permease [Rubinisphaera brasiliensis]|uniref:Uncharacterized protein n=1 Tax=Rubinisphaera brasiliensis (strain ATCC 49424 / DSM 5305 / JCM 21570 / IAM 15109 / NBRC 103401 / IFAM 1448) TaxID=756272 RepID=F0SHF1_RUBBR|nr:DUF3526 domain-containing protein [Rubinisphaera brasiliensis]ADY61706.1 hypothetical protein Plabr_4131 [Rubinisphaera brasiliensis DSM 5305]
MAASMSPLSIRSLLGLAFWGFWKSPGARWLSLVFVILLAVASFSGYKTYQRRLSVIEQAATLAQTNRTLQVASLKGIEDPEVALGRPVTKQEKGRARIQRMIATLPTSLAYTGGNFNALLTPSPMMVLSSGVSDLWPDRFTITAHSQRKNLQREDIASPWQLEAGVWDVTTLAIYLLPLVIVAFTYNVLADDRERGTLAIILSNPIRLDHWVLANLLVRSLSAIVLVLPFALLPVFLAYGSDQLQTVATSSLLWASLVVFYGLFWMAVSLFVVSLGRSSLNNGIVLVVFWFVLVAVVPNGVAEFAQSRQPVMSQQELITSERAFRETAERDGKELKERYYQQHPEVQRPSHEQDRYNQTHWDVVRLETDRQTQPLIRKSLAQVDARFGIHQWGMAGSPALACKLAFDDLSGTSVGQHVEFCRRASEFDEEFKTFFQPRMMSREELTLEDYDQMPAFQYQTLAFERDATLQGTAFLVLSLWTLVVGVAGYRRIQRRSHTA